MSISKIRTALDAGDFETAERLAREVIDANSKDALAHAYLASVLVGRGAAKAARASFPLARATDLVEDRASCAAFVPECFEGGAACFKVKTSVS